MTLFVLFSGKKSVSKAVSDKLRSTLEGIIHLIPKWRKIHYSFVSMLNWPLLPRFKPNIPLNSAVGIEATRAN